MAWSFKLRPNLIEPMPVTVKQINKATTVYDDTLREPVNTITRATEVNLSAQVSWDRTDGTKRVGGGQGGRVNERKGYLVFRSYDLLVAGVTLTQGDKLTAIGSRTYDGVYLWSESDSGHHWDSNELEVWRFEDRAPSRAAEKG